MTDDLPVTLVTWNDAVQFCNWLSDHEQLNSCYRQDANTGWTNVASGTGYRLPTEAEWEYACRAGTTTQFCFGDDPALHDSYAWFHNNSGGGARAVGVKIANAFGLFDMHGNVYEWCQDFYAGDYYTKSPPNDPMGPTSGWYHVYRGGYWQAGLLYGRAAFRTVAPALRYNFGGFRMLRVAARHPALAAAASN